MITYKFILKSNPKKNGLFPVLIRFIQNRQKKYITIGVDIRAEFWNSKKQIIIKHRKKDFYNSIISAWRVNIEQAILKLTIEKRDISLVDFMAMVRHSNFDSFIDWAKNEADTAAIAEGTKKVYYTVIKKIEAMAGNIAFNQLSPLFVDRFNIYMVGIGNNENTRGKNLTTLKILTNKALSRGLISHDPFKDIKIKRGEGSRQFLDIEELKKIEALSFDKIGLERVRINFLFACYTGLRYSDIKALKYSNIYNNCINIKMHKTHLPVSIPLIKKAAALVPVSTIKEQKIFNVASNQVTNRHLKTIAEEADISKNLTFHVARHTFATLGITLGIPLEVISNLLGHTNLKQTSIYAKILMGVKVDYMHRFEEI